MTFPVDRRRREQYLHRLGFDRPPRADLDGLRALHLAHLRSVPFENLDIHLGRPILLEGEAVEAKLLDQGRGGYCYELNGAFWALLAALGFDAALLEARVYGGGDGGAEPEVGIRFDHACLLVRLDDGDWLADVGFGACFHQPLRLRPGVDQPDPGGTYRLTERADGWLDLFENGRPSYRFSLAERTLGDFAEGNHHQQTSPDSHFTHNTVCSLATELGRVTVRGQTLIETTGDDRRETNLAPDELGAVLSDRFGVVLPAGEVARLASAGRSGA